jgi:hypothetical protein
MECPSCHQDDEPRPVGFTWWGGLIGAKLLHHVECPRCGARFNGSTGQSNSTAIAIYMIVVGAIALAILVALAKS